MSKLLTRYQSPFKESKKPLAEEEIPASDLEVPARPMEPNEPQPGNDPMDLEMAPTAPDTLSEEMTPTDTMVDVDIDEGDVEYMNGMMSDIDGIVSDEDNAGLMEPELAEMGMGGDMGGNMGTAEELDDMDDEDKELLASYENYLREMDEGGEGPSPDNDSSIVAEPFGTNQPNNNDQGEIGELVNEGQQRKPTIQEQHAYLKKQALTAVKNLKGFEQKVIAENKKRQAQSRV